MSQSQFRGEVLLLREREFVDAARVLGLGPLRIIFSEILPNLSSTIIVFVPLMIANSILLEAGLSYLGAGVQPPNASWGTMISSGVEYITSSPYLVLVPGITLIVAVLGVNVFGDGLRTRWIHERRYSRRTECPVSWCAGSCRLW